MENIAHRAVIQDHHFTQVRLDGAKVFDICTVPESAVLPIISAMEEFPFLFQPIDDWVSVFLDAGGEDGNSVSV